MVRTPCCDKYGMRKGTWTPEEDKKLTAYVTRYGCWNWRELPKFAGLSRCGKSCRLRWMNYLRPNLKRGNYTKEEDDLIIKLHESLGNRWSAIAAKLPGRTDNEIKNHWHTALSKKSSSKQALSSPSSDEDDINGGSSPKRRKTVKKLQNNPNRSIRTTIGMINEDYSNDDTNPSINFPRFQEILESSQFSLQSSCSSESSSSSSLSSDQPSVNTSTITAAADGGDGDGGGCEGAPGAAVNDDIMNLLEDEYAAAVKSLEIIDNYSVADEEYYSGGGGGSFWSEPFLTDNNNTYINIDYNNYPSSPFSIDERLVNSYNDFYDEHFMIW